MSRRVVITGLGVISPNGMNIPDFLHAIQNGISGVKFIPEYERLKFNCQVSGAPDFQLSDLKDYLTEARLSLIDGSLTLVLLMAVAGQFWGSGRCCD